MAKLEVIRPKNKADLARCAKLDKAGVLVSGQSYPKNAKVKSKLHIDAAAQLKDMAEFIAGLHDHDGIQAGGPGSGCHGPNCGRPGGPAIPHTANGVFKKYGWTSVGKSGKEQLFSHPVHGSLKLGMGFWQHYHPNGSAGKLTKVQVGKSWVPQLHDSLKDLHEAAKPAAPAFKPGDGPPTGMGLKPAGATQQPPPHGLAQEYTHAKFPANHYVYDPNKNIYVNQKELVLPSQKEVSTNKMKWMVDKGLVNAKPQTTTTPSQPAVKPTATVAPKIDPKLPPPGMHESYTSTITGNKYTWNAGVSGYMKKNGMGVVTPDAMMKKGWTPGGKQTPGTYTPTVGKKNEITEPAKASPPAISQTQADFTYKSSGTQLGGAHDKYIFTDKDGKDWLFKPAETLSGQKAALMAKADEAVSKIAAIVKPDSYVEAKVITLNVPGKGQTEGSIQKMQTGLYGAKDFTTHGSNIAYLNHWEINGLAKEQVLDWLVSNHDSHVGQFLRTKDDKVIGIDKTQAFKFFGQDELSTTYQPNTDTHGEKPPIYNEMWKSAVNKQNFDPQSVASTIKAAMSIPDDKYKEMLRPYAEERFGKGQYEASKFLQDAVARKNNLKTDFEAFYSKVLGKPVSIDTADAKQPSVTHGPAPNGVNQDIHDTLAENKYDFTGYGAKTNMALYKNEAGAKIYVKTDGNGFEWYPKGTVAGATQMNGEGAADLHKTLTTKPSESTGMYTETPKVQATGTVDEHGYKMPGYGDTPDMYTSMTGKTTQEEKKALESYQDGGYSKINKSLYLSPSQFQSEYGHTIDDATIVKVKALDSAFKKSVAAENVVVWRKMSIGEYDDNGTLTKKLVDNIQPGMVLEPKSFFSTSINQNTWSGNTTFRISVPAGHPAISYKSASGQDSHSGEKEILLPRTAKYHVTNVEKKGMNVIISVTAIHEKTNA
jgi:hypothetical protein